jgi:hypothetical protein
VLDDLTCSPFNDSLNQTNSETFYNDWIGLRFHAATALVLKLRMSCFENIPTLADGP